MPDLPPPGIDRHGWPWEDEGLHRSAPAESHPRITVVTPSFNQGAYLEATIRSVLLQRYPNLEYLVLDAGSTDDSLQIIRRYEHHLTYWHSRPDDGQADAIASGFELSTGSILCWLNSDDIFLPNALLHVASLFRRHRRTDFIYGNRLVLDEGGNVIDRHIWPWWLFRSHWSLGQPLAQECCFWRRDLYEAVGGIDRSKFFIMDYDLFFRMWRVGHFRKTTAFLGALRQHPGTKNSRHADVWQRELAAAREQYHLRIPGYVGLRVLNRLDAVELRLESLWKTLRKR